MSASGFTPIQLYRSSTAATLPVAGNLAPGELAINTTDEKLYFENTGGTVTLLASSAAAGGTFTTVTATTVVNGLGAVGTPSYTFTGDLNTGMWSPAADTLAFSTAGSERLRIDSSGRLLVGTGSPIGSSTVPVQSPGGFISANDAAGLRLLNSAQDGGGSVFSNTGLNGGISIGSDAGPMLFVSTTERMRISSSGFVGIGNTSPTCALDVTGQITTRGAVGGFVAVSRDGSGADWSLYNPTGDDFRIYGNSADRLTITNAGNVGIGTSAPATVVDASFSGGMVRAGGVAGNNLIQAYTGSVGLGMWAGGIPRFYSTGSMIFSVNSTIGTGAPTGYADAMTITSAGLVGIGTSAPGYNLQVGPSGGGVKTAYIPGTYNFDGLYLSNGSGNGSAKIELVAHTGFSTSHSWKIKHDTDIASGALTFDFAPPAASYASLSYSEKMRIDLNGDFLVGTTSTTSSGITIGKQYGGVSLTGGGGTYAQFGGAYGIYPHAGVGLGLGSALHISFVVAGATEAARITNDGIFHINETSNGFTSAVKLSVTGAANEGAFLFKNSAGNNQWNGWIWNTGASGDNLFISFMTDAGATGRGSIIYNRTAGLLAFNTTSDYRAKDILGPVTDTGVTIDAIKVHNGKMKGATIERPMLVAHEAQEVVPYAVMGEKDALNKDGTAKYQQMDHQSLVPLLIAEVQSLRARVAQLEGN